MEYIGEDGEIDPKDPKLKSIASEMKHRPRLQRTPVNGVSGRPQMQNAYGNWFDIPAEKIEKVIVFVV